MKRILFISPRLSQGGAERQMVTIAKLLKNRGFCVEFLCYSYGDFYEDLLKKSGIKVYWKRHNYLLRLITCTWHIQTNDYDTIISFLPTPCFINCFAAIFWKRWKVITGERSAVVKKPTSLYAKLKVWVQRYADVIVCNSYNSMNLWKGTFPEYEDKLLTIYNTVSLPNINCRYAPLLDNKLHICIAATIYDAKNPLGLIDALRMMTPAELKLIQIDWFGKKEAKIGDSEVYDKTCRIIKESNLHNVIRLHEATKDIAEIMKKADCIALFSKYEGLPNAICEGMMIGKPILMSRVSDHHILVKEGENGFLCNWDEPKSIKEAILKMARLSEKELLSYGERSKGMAQRLFSEDYIIRKWMDIV